MARAAAHTAGPRDLLDTLRHYYEFDTPEAHLFRYGLLAFDLVTVAFIVATSFMPRYEVVEWFDVLFGFVILADFLARIAISRHRLREFAHPATWADIAAIVSFLAPVVGEAGGFLRILRTVRLLRPISSWRACAKTASGSAATRTSSSPRCTSPCSSSS